MASGARAPGAPSAPAWRVAGASVRGASHVRSGSPNQDAIRWLPERGGGPPVALAISDGHGSAKCFRSDVGARLAVETATDTMVEFLENRADVADLAVTEGTTEQLVRRWRRAVEAHRRAAPFSPAEMDTLERRDGAAARAAVEANPFLAYGATLSAVLLAETFVLYLQLGDGDILAVSDQGEVRRPLPPDARLFGGQTTSLCAPHAWRDFRVHFQALSQHALPAAPALILLATDGYANSFRDETGFLKVGSDLLEMIQAEGLEAVANGLTSWLQEASHLGSGDDITLAVACRLDAVERRLPVRRAPSARAPAAPGRVYLLAEVC